eukprot:2187051-Rhodomonas_salina.2
MSGTAIACGVTCLCDVGTDLAHRAFYLCDVRYFDSVSSSFIGSANPLRARYAMSGTATVVGAIRLRACPVLTQRIVLCLPTRALRDVR